jgi:hypothetical protein
MHRRHERRIALLLKLPEAAEVQIISAPHGPRERVAPRND